MKKQMRGGKTTPNKLRGSPSKLLKMLAAAWVRSSATRTPGQDRSVGGTAAICAARARNWQRTARDKTFARNPCAKRATRASRIPGLIWKTRGSLPQFMQGNPIDLFLKEVQNTKETTKTMQMTHTWQNTGQTPTRAVQSPSSSKKQSNLTNPPLRQDNSFQEFGVFSSLREITHGIVNKHPIVGEHETAAGAASQG